MAKTTKRPRLYIDHDHPQKHTLAIGNARSGDGWLKIAHVPDPEYAALIVRAVNAYDALTDLLERAHDICDSISDGAPDASPLERQALQLAGEIKAMLSWEATP